MNALSRSALAALLLAATATPAAMAQPPDGDLAARRRRVLSTSPRGPAFRVGSQEYQVVAGLRAAAVLGQATAEQAVAGVGASPADVLERKGPWVVFASSAGGAVPSSTRAVAVNVRTGQLGVVTGTVAVRMASTEGASDLARAHGLAVDWVAHGTGYAFLRVPPGGDAVAAAAALAGEPGVRSAEVEVKEAFAVPL